MKKFACFGKKLQHLCSSSCQKIARLTKSILFLFAYFNRFVLLRMNPFWFQILYFVFLSFLGFWGLKAFKPKTHDSFNPRNIDMFFTSVSATTVSSMSTVEMEVFSNSQLIILTIVMFIGGEVFTSMVGLHLRKYKLKNYHEKVISINTDLGLSNHTSLMEQIELGLIRKSEAELVIHNQLVLEHESMENERLKYSSIKFLEFVVLGYLVVIHVIGLGLVSLYFTVVSSAREVLKNKSLKMFTFYVFATVSTFASCGFVPTNENMMVFSKNSGLLLILIPQVLMGNTLFPSCLRFSIWVLGKFVKKTESDYLLKKTGEVGYLHLLPSLHSILLVATVCGFILVQLAVFSSLEWNAEALSGLNSYQKFIGVIFQSVNSRHTGETIVDLSIISPAILVLFIVMMYLPPYTSFLLVKDGGEKNPRRLCGSGRTKKRSSGKVVENLIFSQLSYLVIFIILICITERNKLKEDPLNFNVLNIVLEVISAYGNVGFTTGYGCKRQLHPDANCQDKWIGFSGKWSDEGKIILIVVMFFGRLKKFTMDGGRAWKLL
ncbi:Sodium transporter HKT1-like [Quillaja saponaria]|uniref:Sodium transporter HKT1-like n=1 Tax=Quillaja saponaria TaxID=32244 RepID=A0AAD7Q2L8_QUISA|nr:Sodium transporter HKT1-like [Quillaja saponaria]